MRSAARLPVRDRSVLANVPGIRSAAAVGVALGFTVVGFLIDLVWVGTAATMFQVCYVLGCVLAVAWIRRYDVFVAMVQPPLLLLFTIPVVYLVSSDPEPGQGIAQQLLVVGAPLVNAFPTMALATVLTVAGGLARIAWQRQGWGSDHVVDEDAPSDDADGLVEPTSQAQHTASPGRSAEPLNDPLELDEAPGEGRRRGFPQRS